MRRLVILLALVACRDPVPTANVGPASDSEAASFAKRLLEAVKAPNCEATLGPMIDHDALAVKVGEMTHQGGKQQDAVTTVIAKRRSGATVLCAWLGTGAQFQLMHVLPGPRVVLRKLLQTPHAKVQGVAYYAFDLGKSRADGVVRLVDAYSFLEGAQLTELLGQVVDTMLATGTATSVRDTMAEIKQLRAAHKPTEALAKIDGLPDKLRALRSLQMMRAGVAREISDAEYARVLDEIAQKFPNDPSVAMLEIDGAILNKRYDDALRYIDIVDKAVGGDAFQEAVRSTVYYQKGDFAQALVHADAAVTAEPTLARGWMSKLDAVLAQKQWPAALDVIDHLAPLGTTFADDAMRASHVFDGLVASPEYAAWRVKHP